MTVFFFIEPASTEIYTLSLHDALPICPIEGLYAIGGDGSAVLYGDTYGVNIPGTHAGYCIFSGRNAIKAIAAQK